METVKIKCNPENEGLQQLVYSDEHLNVIVRNQNRMGKDIQEYEITIKPKTQLIIKKPSEDV